MDEPGNTPSYTRKPLFGDQKWLITRQPYPSDASKHPLLEIPPAQRHPPPAWQLYDGRYWLRVSNFTAHPLRVRPLRKEDLQPFRAALEEPARRKLRRLLCHLAPGRVRFTLPAIAAERPSGAERVVALPTLDIGVSGVGEVLEYAVRYKHVAGPVEDAARDGGVLFDGVP